MSLLKQPQQSSLKTIILANNNIDMWKKYDDKTLLDVDSSEKLIDIKIGKSTNPKNGDEIESLILEFEDKKVAFPMSRGLSLDTSVLTDPEVLVNCKFNVRRKTVGDEDPSNASGPEYISFGKPSGIRFEEESSLVPAEEGAEKK